MRARSKTIRKTGLLVWACSLGVLSAGLGVFWLFAASMAAISWVLSENTDSSRYSDGGRPPSSGDDTGERPPDAPVPAPLNPSPVLIGSEAKEFPTEVMVGEAAKWSSET